MKKSNLFTGLIYISLGIVCLVQGLIFNTKLNDLWFGFAGAGIIPGFAMVFRYFYWTSAKNKAKYAERIEQEQIELQDERKQKLRDKSGRYAYILGLVVIGLTIIIIAILGNLELISNFRLVIIYLYGYFVFQFVSGIIIFRYLNNKY